MEETTNELILKLEKQYRKYSKEAIEAMTQTTFRH